MPTFFLHKNEPVLEYSKTFRCYLVQHHHGQKTHTTAYISQTDKHTNKKQRLSLGRKRAFVLDSTFLDGQAALSTYPHFCGR